MNSRLVFVGLCLQFLAIDASGQQALPSKFIGYQHAFTSATSVRELQNGSVLVVEKKERQLVLLATPDVNGTVIGRRGNGPGEYGSPDQLFPLKGDSSILHDAVQRRWQLLIGSRIVRTFGADNVVMQALRVSPTSADGQGHMMALRGFSVAGGRRGILSRNSDSALVVRATLGGIVDTVARLRGGWVAPTRLVGRVVGGLSISYQLEPLMTTEDQATLCPDGSVVVVGGTDVVVRRGTAVSGGFRFEVVKQLDKRLIAVTPSVMRRAVAEKFATAAAISPKEIPYWPRTIPELARGGLWCTHSGEIVVNRGVAPGEPPRIDVVTLSGGRVRTYVLPLKARIVGVGLRSLYVVAVDEDDVEHIRRYAWPVP